MYDYGARYYNPSIGRFLSVDPLASDFAAWTPYHYVHNNPILLIDPFGMAADTLPQPSNSGNTLKDIAVDTWNMAKWSFSGLFDEITSITIPDIQGEQQQNTGDGYAIFGKWSKTGSEIKAPTADPNGEVEVIDISDMNFTGAGNKSKWIKLTKSEELESIYNLMKSSGKAKDAVNRLTVYKQVSKNDTIYNCEACNGVYRDSSGVKIRTSPNANKPQKTLKTHYK